MSDDHDSEADGYDVGFRKPPIHKQFKKGQSGNRRGRPKGTKNLKTDFRDVAEEQLSIRKNGKTTKVSTQKAVLMQLASKAAAGDARAMNNFLTTSMKLFGDEFKEAVDKNFDESRREIVARYRERVRAEFMEEMRADERTRNDDDNSNSGGFVA